jgi:hypothetical protein
MDKYKSQYCSQNTWVDLPSCWLLGVSQAVGNKEKHSRQVLLLTCVLCELGIFNVARAKRKGSSLKFFCAYAVVAN